MKMQKSFLLTIAVLFASGVISTIFASVPPPPPPTVVPIDGGVSFLVVACAGYGAKKIHDYRKGKEKK
jgi:hypothetical protein